MCACRQRKSFFIEDILQDTAKNKTYRNLSNEPPLPLKCSGNTETPKAVSKKVESDPVDEKLTEFDFKTEAPKAVPKRVESDPVDEKLTKFDVICEVQKEIQLNKINLEQRRNTYPIYPTPMKVNIPWQSYSTKDPIGYPVEHRSSFNYYSESMLNTEQVLRNQLAANRFVHHPLTIRQSFGFDRVGPSCCNPWWSLGGRRKGGQVRFSAAQTGALERRFNASKYLSPDERRSLAVTLRLSDRQVKTWFQNRRAKWRRTTPDSADAGSPPTADESDEDVQIAEDE